jgi:hypothetical protein
MECPLLANQVMECPLLDNQGMECPLLDMVHPLMGNQVLELHMECQVTLTLVVSSK